MLISLDNLGKTFFDVENIYLQLKNDKKQSQYQKSYSRVK